MLFLTTMLSINRLTTILLRINRLTTTMLSRSGECCRQWTGPFPAVVDDADGAPGGGGVSAHPRTGLQQKGRSPQEAADQLHQEGGVHASYLWTIRPLATYSLHMQCTISSRQQRHVRYLLRRHSEESLR